MDIESIAVNDVFSSVGNMVREAIGTISWQAIVSLCLLEVSLILTLLYVVKWQKNYGVYYTLIFTLVPISQLGQLILTTAESAGEAMIGMDIIYIGGCFLVFFINMAIIDICRIKVKKWIKVVLLFLNMEMYINVVMTEYTGLFYRSISYEKVGNTVIMTKEYGPFHTLFTIMIFSYFSVAILMVLYSLFFKKNVSNKRAILLLLTEGICFAAFLVTKHVQIGIDIGTTSYLFAQVVFLIIIRRISLFSIRDNVADSLVRQNDDGYISFDKRLKYIGYIGVADEVYPWLKNMQVDRRTKKKPQFQEELLPMIYEFRERGKSLPRLKQVGDKYYQMVVNSLYNGKRRAGYQIHIVDDTWDQLQIQRLDRFNDRLHEQVEEKTKHIQQMHDNLILSMATMVESRDNSTGGHIRRTSDVVRMLVEEMKKDPEHAPDEKFCRDIIKAAPMHDLGKIAVPDSILQKPGRFEDWEFEQMKKHAAEGARIVHEILKSTDDNAFHILAENVAHYHHERWDGSGYPEGLSGENIPYEARIMAVADVYDALVSKRVYKERMSYEKADSIIMEGMGKHFDPSLEPYYVAVRPRLEAYYDAEDER